ncbi:hypothetical protein [Bacillus cereus group sp. BfR-BA-01380]|uniref:hypothetical protein n=1 Tax=Bacillus cereus group sp. BfR-BA-01380 TaxID=2920324 RepID=UPI001F577AFA|nr:hypothetical protein [Bacillus cereus group sp. BfR-BA-01380]
MDTVTITKIIETLQSYGFQNVAYCEKTKQYLFHNETDIMSGYAAITYSAQFEKFSVQIHPIETHYLTELQEVEKHIQSCIQKVEHLNTIIEKQYKNAEHTIIL